MQLFFSNIRIYASYLWAEKIYHSRYDVGLDTDTENSLLLGVWFSSIKFAQQNIWQNLHTIAV